MKSYKEFETIRLGASDIASLMLRGGHGEIAEMHFGGDGAYAAYYVTEKAEIGSHYREIFRTKSWLWIYDDEKKTVEIHAPEISVYRAGERGCIIYAPTNGIE